LIGTVGRLRGQEEVGMANRKIKRNKNTEVAPCKEGHNRWKTIKKGLIYQCRVCGEVRSIVIGS
jgi:peptide methionine sulfoxide reductase MsrB